MTRAEGVNRGARGPRTGRGTAAAAVRAGHLLTLFAVLCNTVLPARGAPNTWTAGSGTDFNWDTNANWSLTLKPVASDDVVFPTPVPNPALLVNPSVITLGTGELANGLTFLDSYTLNGGDLTLSAGLDANSGKIVVADTMTATINSVLSGTGVTVIKTGAGTLVLTGANTFDGPVQITGGVLSTNLLANGGVASGLGMSSSSAANLVIDGGGLRYTGSAVTTDRLFTVGAGGATLDASGGGAVTFGNSGSIGYVGTGARTITLSGSNTDANMLASLVADAGTDAVSLAKSGTGVWIVTGNNTYSGNTTISAGTLTVGNGGTSGSLGNGDIVDNGALVFNRGDSVTLSNAISGTGSLAQSGSGTLILTGNNSYDSTIVNSGTLQVGSGGTIGTLGSGAVTNNASLVFNRSDGLTVGNAISGSGSLTQNGTGTLVLSGANGYSGTTSINAGVLSIGASNNLGNGAATNTISIANNATLQSTGASVDLGSTRALAIGAGGATIDVTAGNQLIASGVISGASGNALSKSGAGTLLLKPGNTFSGPLNLNQGAVAVDSVANDSQLGGVTAINFNGGVFSQAVDGQYSVSGTRVFNVGASGGTFDVGLAGANPSNRKIFLTTGQLVGAGALSKTGGGDLQLSAANSGYSGAWSISGGVVEAQNNASLGTGAVTVNTGGELVVTMPAAVSNPITLAGGTLSANGTSGGTPYVGPINVSSNSNVALRLFQATGTGSSFRMTGPLSGSGNLNVTAPAAATLTLAGDTSGYTGRIVLGNNAILAGRMPAPTGGATPGTPGLNATYYNFGTSEGTAIGIITGVGGTLSQKFAVDQLYVSPRTVSLVEPTINVRDTNAPGSGTWPTNYIPGFHVNQTNNNNDGAMWKGLINITAGGTYTFTSASDDNSGLWIDGVLVVNNDTVAGHGFPGPAPTGTITLTPGYHSIVAKFSQGGGGTGMVVSYNGADTGGATVIIPSSVLNTGSLAGAPVPALGVANGTSTFDFTSDSVTPSLTMDATTANAQLNLSSPTVSTLRVAGTTTLNATAANASITLAPGSGALVFDGSITGTGSTGTGAFTVAGPYLTQFNAANSYTGLTRVTGGQLNLNATGGDAIPGDLTVNAANTSGLIRNVRLLQSDQIADTSTVTVTQGILDIGANSDTVAKIVLNGGTITGTVGVLTPGALDLQGGTLNARLGGAAAMTKTGAGTLVLGGDNSAYGGAISVATGVLAVRGNNTLGNSTGDTTVLSGAALQLLGGINLGGENVTISGTGVSNDGALRNMAGDNTIGGAVTVSGPSLVQSESGNLIFGASGSVSGDALTVQGAGDVTFNSNPTLASITKRGVGTLTFGTNQSSLAGVDFQAGTLGFSGPQSFGPATIPDGRAFRFNSDPGAGVTITSPANTRVIAGYAPDATLLSRLTTDSTGTLVLTGDTSNDLDFSAGPNMALGAQGRVVYGGTITPNSGTYRLGGGGGELTLTQPLTGNNAVAVTGTVLLPNVNTFTGGVTVDAGGAVRVINNTSLGSQGNAVTLTNGGVLTLIANTDNAGNQFGQLGNPVNDGAVPSRNIVIGSGGGVIDLPTRLGGSTGYAITGTLSGSGTLTKAGFGNLLMFSPATFGGDLVIAPNSGQFEMRASGSLSSVNSVTVGQSTLFVVDNQNGLGQRQYASVNNNNRVNDAAAINLQGGQLLYRARNTAAQTSETFGTVTLGAGQNQLRSELANNTSQGSDIIFNNLVRSGANNGTLLFTTNNNGFAAGTGSNNRVKLSAINGIAPTADIAVLPWGTINSSDVPMYNFAGNAVQIATYTAAPAGNINPTASQVLNLTATAASTYTLTGGTSPYSVNAMRFGGAANAQTIAFANATDVLNIVSGGIYTDNGNAAHIIGSASGNGRITAGPVGATGPQELFVHNNTNTLTINSIITDNGTQPVSLIKDLDAPLQLSAANTYSGGTFVYRSRINTTVAGALGSGPVLVKGGNSVLQLGAAGATSNTSGIVATDQGEIFLNSQGPWTNPGDRFIIAGAGSMITGSESVANQGLNSLTRVATPGDVAATPTGGVVYLVPGSMVSPTNMVNGDIGTTNMIKNLGTAADLFFSPSGANANVNTTLTVGAGTPWKGIATGPTGRQLSAATIFANGDIVLQGSARDNTVAVLTLGQANSPGTISYVNNAGKPINFFVQGQVALSEDNPVFMDQGITFVVQPGAFLQPNFANSFGQPGSTANVLVQAGGTLDPGNFVPVGVAGNQPVGFAYPAPSNMNANITLEAEARMILNDASGAGSTTNGNTWNFRSGSILHLATAQALLGSYNPGTGNTGLINPAQFNLDPGVTVRIDADNVFDISHSVLGSVNGDKAVIQLVNANRNLTNQVSPMTGLVAPENILVGNGGMITDDESDRQVNEGRGKIILGDGAILAGTNQTFLNMQEGLELQPGATITIGSNKWINGQPKLGAVNLGNTNGPNSNVGDETNTFNVLSGATLMSGAVNVIPDKSNINLPAAVTAFPTPGAAGNQPGNGSTLVLAAGNFIEVMGKLTGNGAVVGNTGGAGVAPGFGGSGEFTFNGVFKSTNGQNPELYKVGTGKMILTGASDSTGNMGALQGTIELSGAGNTKFGTVRAMEGGTVVLNNTATALNNRLGNPSFVVPSGGTYNLIGNDTTPVTEAIQTLANSVGAPGALPNATTGYTYFNITPGAATTNLAVTNLENFQANGIGQQRSGTWVLRSPSIGNAPGSYNANGVYAPNPANTTTGLFLVTNPNFFSNGSFGVGSNAIAGQAGTPVAPARGDYLGDTSTTGQGVGFLTVDSATTGMRLLAASEYSSALRDNLSTNLNVKASGTLNTGGDTRIQTLTLTPGTTLNIIGTLPLNSTPSRLVINDMGILVQAGAASTINGDPGTFLQANANAANVALFLHTFGDLNLNAKVFTDTAVVKTNAGTLNVGAGAFSAFRGSLEVDDGTVNLAGGNTFANVRNGATGFNAGGSLFLNGGTLNLNGNSLLVSQLTNNNPLFGQGGTVTSATPATLTVQGGGQFSGSVGGAISLDKVNTNTLALTSANTYTGSTAIRAGTLTLRDQGTLANTSNVDLYYGSTLGFDNGYLGNVVNRINPAAVLNVRGGNIQMTGAAGQVASQSIATLNLLSGRLDYNGNSGGNGAVEFNVGNFVRGAGTGSTFTINQNFGFTGTAGNTTDAIRFFINNLNGSPLALNDGIIGGWAVMNGGINGAINFMTYKPAVGIGTYGNTADGFNAYESGDVTAATATQNVNDTTAARTITASKTINSLRTAANAASTLTLNASVGLTIDSGGWIIDNNNTTALSPAASTTGQFITSNSGELDVWINQNTATFNVPVTDNIDLVKSGGGTLALAAANTYTGKTFVNSGTLNLSLAGANGSSVVATQGDVVVTGSGVLTETVANQLKTNAAITLLGNARFNAMNAAGITETIGALVFGDAAGAPSANNALDIFDRTASQPTSTLLLSSPTAISGTNTNPNIVPFIGAFAGNVGFTNAGGSTINVNAPTSANGLAALGLRIDAAVNQVPTGLAEGGLIKKGTGVLVLNPTNNTVFAATGSTTTGSNTITLPSTTGLVVGQTITGTGIPNGSYITSIVSATQVTLNNNATATAAGTIAFTANIVSPWGNPTTLTDTLNVSEGIVRADQSGALGSQFANTTVQGGAGLLGDVANGQPVLGSVKLKDGSFLGVTINSTTFGAATPNTALQAVMNIAGNTTFYAQDYFIPTTNGGNITINGRLTGSGNINIVGPQISGSSGTVTLGNPITTGAGSNDYSGTITVNTNAILRSQPALVAPATLIGGSTLGTGSINLNGGTISLRDDVGGLSNTSIAYNNNVTLSATSFADANRVNGGGANDAINLGTLTVPGGSPAMVTPFTTNPLSTLNNNYRVGFASIDGAGTLVKGGHQAIDLNGYAPTFSGNLAVAGPQGLSVASSAGLNLNAPTNNINNLTVNGIHSFLGNTTSVAGTLEVGNNSGSIVNGTGGTSTGSVTGMLAVPNTATVSAATLKNNGQVASTGGNATVTANTIKGQGLYQTFGQPLTLIGALADDGATPTRLKVAGDNVLTLSATGAGTNTGGAEVQSGTLRVTAGGNVTNPLGTGPIRVMGSAASALSSGATASQPQAAIAGILQFDAGAGNSISQSGNIANSGTVHAKSGVTSIGGTITGTATEYVPGLREGFVQTGTLDPSLTRAANPAQFGIRLEPRMGQTNVVTQNAVTGWGDNNTWVYTGEFFDADGKFTFAENIDDNVLISIDGVTRLLSNTGTNPWQTVTSTASTFGQRGNTVDTQTGTAPTLANGNTAGNVGGGTALDFGMGPNGDGWHTFEARFTNGGGGAGPVAGNGFANNFGFGLNTSGTSALDGSVYQRPIDPGDGSLFRTAVGGSGDIQVDADATLNVGGFTLIKNLNITASPAGTTLKVTAAGTSAADNLNVTGTGGTATVDKVAGVTVNLTNVNVAAGTTLVLAGDASSITNLGTSSLALNGNLTVNGGLVVSNSAGTGSGIVTLNGGVLQTNLLADGGVASGIGQSSAAASNLILNGGTLRYNGAGASTDRLFTLGASGATIESSGAGALNFTGTGNIDAPPAASTPNTRTLVMGGSNTDTSTFAPILSDAGANDLVALNKVAANTLILLGDSTYTGGTTIAAGTLQLGNGGATGGITGNVIDNASLVVNRGNTFTYGGVVSGTGSLTQAGTGTTVLTNANTYTGGTTIAGGVLQLGDGTSTGSFTGNVANNANLAFNQPAPFNFGGTISGPGSVSQLGAKVSLAADNSYAGGTTIAAGSTLEVGTGGTTGSVGSGAVTFAGAGATLAFNRSDNVLVTPGVISGPGSVEQNGTGKVTLSGTSTYSGATTVNNGTLAVTGSIAGSSGVTVNSAGTFEADATQTVRKLSVNGGQAVITGGARKVLTVGDNTADYSSPANQALSITTPGKLDLTTNGLIVDHAAGADSEAVKSVRTLITQGYNGGDWLGNGITSSDAAANASSRGVGYALSSEAAAIGTFLGQAVDASSVVARDTLLGDATLDGTVDFVDLVQLAQNYNTTVSDVTESWWYRGDFNYDGLVDFTDLVRLAQNYNTSLPAPLPAASAAFNEDLTRAFSEVPEPSSALTLAALAGLACLGRRRSRQA
jgi:autotransporter-associated beta strand protein